MRLTVVPRRAKLESLRRFSILLYYIVRWRSRSRMKWTDCSLLLLEDSKILAGAKSRYI
jgi:hypothetical protein